MSGSLLYKNFSRRKKAIERLGLLAKRLKKSHSIREKVDILDDDPLVKKTLKNPHPLSAFLSELSLEYELVVKSIIAIEQAERVFSFSPEVKNPSERLGALLEVLLPVERFYEEIGGIVGYHMMMLSFLSPQDNPSQSASVVYHRPEGVDISQDHEEVRKAVLWGIAKMEELCEIYPLGGAADRLNLFDDKTGSPLPAARLNFCGKTLLEGLIADLQAREYVHYKLFGKQVLTPIGMMASYDKENETQIHSICEEKKWFGRKKESFRFFCQPLVPVVNREGQWCLQGPMHLLLKPGGHGVIWKLARDQGVFEWFFSLGRKKGLVRQINNPIAGLDHGLFAFTGLGCEKNKHFGFASCQRKIRASEGVNVLIEKKQKRGYEYTLTSIEYCDFATFSIKDEPDAEESPYSKFPSNTNILFIDLQAVLSAIEYCPLPGQLVNFKKVTYQNENGEMKEEEIARLESTMQNIADLFFEEYKNPLAEGERDRLKVFLTYNERIKTISTTKKAWTLGSSLLETPEGCFLDLLKNAYCLLVEKCQMEVSKDSFLFLYHPALGPLYAIIAQKVRGGKMARGSELQLEIADVDIEALDLEGSCLIRAEALMGDKNCEGELVYSHRDTGKCTLKNVKIRNQGIDQGAPNVFWKNEIFRKESCSIVLHGNGEFYAEDVTFEGPISVEVETGMQVVAVNEKGKVVFLKNPIRTNTWSWTYSVDGKFRINLHKKRESEPA